MIRRPVDTMTASELHDELVNDAVCGVFTPIQRFYQACERIGRLTGKGAEAAYLEVRDDAKVRGAVGMFMS